MRAPRGKINLIGLALLLAIVAGIYSLVMFSTPVLDNLDVKEKIDAAYNQSGKTNDEGLKRFIEDGLRQVGEHEQEDGYGNVKTVPGLALTDDDITIERNEVASTITIRIDYARKVILKPTQRPYFLRFHPSRTGPIPQ